MDAGIIDDNLDGLVLNQRPKYGNGRGTIGYIECNRLGTAAGSVDFLHQLPRFFDAMMRMDINVASVGSEAAADGSANIAAATRDQSSFHRVFPEVKAKAAASRMTAARPVTSTRPAVLTLNSLTLNS